MRSLFIKDPILSPGPTGPAVNVETTEFNLTLGSTAFGPYGLPI